MSQQSADPVSPPRAPVSSSAGGSGEVLNLPELQVPYFQSGSGTPAAEAALKSGVKESAVQDDWGPGVQCPKSGQLSPWRALLSHCFSEAPGLVWLHLQSALRSLLSSLTRHLGQAWVAG